MSVQEPTTTKRVFGVEEGSVPYRLRQARYHEIGAECADWAQEHHQTFGRNLDLLDIGTLDGVLRKYAELRPGVDHINWSAVDLYPFGQEFVYKHDQWTHHNIDLEEGLPGLADNAFDVVVCEQVLEHLHHPQVPLAAMYRVLRPGGRLVLGVPIFPPGLDLVRKHVVPVTDRWRKKQRGHVQGWSKASFVKLIRRVCPQLKIEQCRGFRVISGGPLRPLEYTRWWWQLNRRVGRAIPSMCIELQVIAQKPATEAQVSRQAA